MANTTIAGLIRVIEHGSVSARRGRAICAAIYHHVSITHLQRKQDATSELFWRVASEQKILELLCAGTVPPTLMCKNAPQLVIGRDLGCVLAVILYQRSGRCERRGLAAVDV